MSDARMDEFGYRGFRLWREQDGFHGQRLLTGVPLEGAPYEGRSEAMIAVDVYWTTQLAENDKESQ